MAAIAARESVESDRGYASVCLPRRMRSVATRFWVPDSGPSAQSHLPADADTEPAPVPFAASCQSDVEGSYSGRTDRRAANARRAQRLAAPLPMTEATRPEAPDTRG